MPTVPLCPSLTAVLGRVVPLLTLAVAGLLPLATQGGIHRASVSASVADKASREEPVEVLVLLDDALQARQLSSALGGPSRRGHLDRAAYANFAATQRSLMQGLKSDVLLQAADPDVDVLTDYDMLPVLHARIRSARALENLRRQGRVKAIEAIRSVRTALAESLPLIGQPEVAAAGHIGTGTAVAVLDTGVDYTRTAFGSCSTPGGACKVAHAQDFATQDNALDTGNYHGTNVAGIVLGVAPATKILALDVFEANGQAYSNVLLAAVNWCIANKATYNIAAINMSLGGGQHFSALSPTDSFGVALQNAINAGIAVIVASGNNGYTNAIAWPAAYSNVVSVGAFYDAGASERQVTSFSNSASFLTMLAPGSMITAAGISMQGTSQATPHVAGAAAVLRGVYSEDTVAQLVNRLKLGAPVVDSRNGISKPGLSLTASTAVPPATYKLTVGKAGSGTGTITASAGGIDCGSVCSGHIANGDSVTLTALHGPNAQFTGWTGDCAGSGVTCTVAMTAARSVGAGFVTMTQEDFLSGGAVPNGWGQSVGTAAGWSAVSGGAYVGTHALQAGAVSQGQSAGVTVSGSFRAGAVSFARRVASSGGQDALKFYIDGQLQGSWTGTTAWGMVAFPVSAGNHTLTWVFEKSGSSTSDGAWIDSVNLPWSAATDREAGQDFDGDGRVDILWRNAVSGKVALWFMDAGNRLSGSGSLPAPADVNWQIAGTGDFNGDGHADILWRHAALGRTSIWFMNGLERLSVGNPPGIADTAWAVVGIGDFDDDGKADVLFRHGSNGRNVMWLMDGATRLSSVELPATGDTRWLVVGVDDFDGDGKADILWRNYATGGNAVWLMDGAIRAASTALPAVSDTRWRVAGTGDFDGDGKADILYRHTGDGRSAVWFMDGAARTATAAPPTVANLDWRIAGVGDFNADGKADVLWRHIRSGALSVWTMDGGTRTAFASPPPLADLNWQPVAPSANPN